MFDSDFLCDFWENLLSVIKQFVFDGRLRFCSSLVLIAIPAAAAFGQTCTTGSDMEPATKAALLSAGQRYFDLLARGDSASLKQSAIPSLASDFSAIEATVKDNQPALSGAKATPRSPFVLEATGTAAQAKADFYCGVFGASGQTSSSAVFYLNSLPPGKYGVVILDTAASKGAYTVSFILQLLGSDWKLGGLYIRAAQTVGHDSEWFVTRARTYQSKGQLHNAWFYFLEARSLVSPMPFMSTAVTDKLYDESQKSQPTDLPAEGKTADLPSGATTYKLTDLFPEVVGNDLDLIVKYQVASVADTNQAYQSNAAVIKALVTKYPELRDAFAGVVARAVDPSGHDYGTMLAMKDIK